MTTVDIERLKADMRLYELSFSELLDAIATEAVSWGSPDAPEVNLIREEIARRWSAARNDNPLAWAGHLNLERPGRTARYAYACKPAGNGVTCVNGNSAHREAVHGGRPVPTVRN
jgi:hypothetical protein